MPAPDGIEHTGKVIMGEEVVAENVKYQIQHVPNPEGPRFMLWISGAAGLPGAPTMLTLVMDDRRKLDFTVVSGAVMTCGRVYD